MSDDKLTKEELADITDADGKVSSCLPNKDYYRNLKRLGGKGLALACGANLNSAIHDMSLPDFFKMLRKEAKLQDATSD